MLWHGPLSALTHTECKNCGAHNSHIVDEYSSDAECLSESDRLIIRFLTWMRLPTPRADGEFQEILRDMRHHIGDVTEMVQPNTPPMPPSASKDTP